MKKTLPPTSFVGGSYLFVGESLYEGSLADDSFLRCSAILESSFV